MELHCIRCGKKCSTGLVDFIVRELVAMEDNEPQWVICEKCVNKLNYLPKPRTYGHAHA